MNSPYAQDQRNGNFTQTSDWFTYNQSTRNRSAELDAYKRAFSLVQLRTLAERLHFRGNVYALNAKQLTEEIEKRERRMLDALSLGTIIKDDEGDMYRVSSCRFKKDDGGARTVELVRRRDLKIIRIPLYDLLSMYWSIQPDEAVGHPGKFPVKKIDDYFEYFTQRLMQLLNGTLVDAQPIKIKAKILAKTAREKKQGATDEYLERIAYKAASDLLERNR